MPIKCYIEDTDVSAYFKMPVQVEPGGDGVVGVARLNFDQQAGGLDIRDMMNVRVWQTFNAAGAGISQRGRLFGGRINLRATGNIGTTKTWQLGCWDYNVLLHKIVRDAQPAKAVVLTADTFGAQIATLVQQVQRNGHGAVNTEIDAVSQVADLYPTMPAVTYPGGRKLGWYILQLCNTANLLDDTIIPHFYMGTDTTFGVGDTFGNPLLYIYDGALTPPLVFSLSDTAPAGGRKPIFGTFKRATDAKAISQRRQSRFANLYFTAQDSTSQSTYPNPYINHGGASDTGYWMNEVIQDTESTSSAEAQANLDRTVAAEANPIDSFEGIETEERVLPGEYVGLGWALESIAEDTPFLVAKVTTRIEPPEVLVSTLTLNARRLGLFPNGTQIFARPIEGDTNPPLPPVSASVTSNTYNWDIGQAELVLLIGASPSPDASGYVVVGTLTSPTGDVEPYESDVGLNLTPSLYVPPGHAYSLRVHAYDNAGNRSDPFPEATDPALTGTTASPSVPAPTALLVDTARGTAGYEYLSGTQARAYHKFTAPGTLPDYYIHRLGVFGTSPTLWTPHIVHRDTTSFLVPSILATGGVYAADIVAVRGSVRSTVATLTTFTVPAYTGPAAPVVTNIATGVDKGGPYAKVRVTHAGDHSGGGNVFAARTGGAPTDAPIIVTPIPRNWTSPIWITVRDVALSVSYDFTATVLDSLGVPNSTPSNTLTAVIKPAPGGDGPYDTGWDHYAVDADPAVRDLEHEVANGGSFAFDNTTLYDNQDTLEITVTGAGRESLLLPDRYPAHEGDKLTGRAAVRGSLSGPSALFEVVWFDATDVELSRDTIFSGGTSTTFTKEKGKTPGAPANTEYARVALNGDGGSAGTVHWSRPVLTKEISKEIADDAIVGDMINPVFTLSDQVVTLGGTSSLVAGGGKVTVDNDGIKLAGTATGANNIDFYNEVAVRIGRMYSAGPSGSGSLNIVADYNGGGSTDLAIGATDSIGLSVSALSEQIAMNLQGVTVNPGSSARKTIFNQGSVVVGVGNLATTATDGFLYVSTSAGPPTGVPTTQLDTAPLHWDSTNHRLYVYSGGAWKIVSISVADKTRLDRIHTPVSKTATFTADLVSGAYLVSASGGAVVANLPAVSGNAGLWYFIKKTDSSTNTVTLEPSGAETIDGAANLILYTQDHAAIIYCDGATWWVFASLGIAWRGLRANGQLVANGGITTTTIAPNRIAKTSSYTIDTSSSVYESDCTSGAITATLVTAPSVGRIYGFIKTDSSTNALTIDANASELIDGALTVVLNRQWQAVLLQSTSTGWTIIGGVGYSQGVNYAPQYEAATSTKTASFTADALARTYLCNNTSDITATLPAAAGCTGRQYTFVRIGTHKVTLDGNASETINGITTMPLVEKYHSVTIESNGSNWHIVNQSGLQLSSDGTRWLGPELTMSMTPRATNSLQPYTANDWVQHVPWKSTREIWLTSWVMANHVVGTNSGASFWTLDLLRTDNDTAVATITTAAHGPNSWESQEVTSFTGNPLPTTVKGIELELIKTGTPGGIYPEIFLKAREVYS